MTTPPAANSLLEVIRNHHTGQPAGAHLKITTRVLAGIPQPAAESEQPWMPQPLGVLAGIDFVIDDCMLDGWQLVDTRTGLILARGDQ